MNYNKLFNVFYSDLPESVKDSVLENLPEELLLEGLNESVDTYRPILEVLDILAYSEDITEEKANAVIDEIFSNIDEQVAEEILEAYSKEKFIQYIEEAMLCETDAIGLKQALEQGNEARRKRVEGELRNRARRQAINKVKSNLIHKGAELSQKAVTGAREATEKAISKGAELKANAISKGAELKDKFDSKVKKVKSGIANKVGDLKDKAVTGIKNAVGKVKDWAKKATEPSAKDYASAIGKKASDNELKIKPGSYADRYAKAMNKYQQKYGEVKPATDKKVEPEKVEASTKGNVEKLQNLAKVSNKLNYSTSNQRDDLNKKLNDWKVKNLLVGAHESLDSLEQLGVSEECFDEIMGIVEEILSEDIVSTANKVAKKGAMSNTEVNWDLVNKAEKAKEKGREATEKKELERIKKNKIRKDIHPSVLKKQQERDEAIRDFSQRGGHYSDDDEGSAGAIAQARAEGRENKRTIGLDKTLNKQKPTYYTDHGETLVGGGDPSHQTFVRSTKDRENYPYGKSNVNAEDNIRNR